MTHDVENVHFHYYDDLYFVTFNICILLAHSDSYKSPVPYICSHIFDLVLNLFLSSTRAFPVPWAGYLGLLRRRTGCLRVGKVMLLLVYERHVTYSTNQIRR